jgi:hypothetical protein
MVATILPLDGFTLDAFMSSRLSLLPVDGDQICNDFRRGDSVLAAPCDGFPFDGLYVVDIDGRPIVYRVQDLAGQVTLLHDRGREFDGVPRAWFDDHVLGIIVCDLKVRDAQLLRRAWEGRHRGSFCSGGFDCTLDRSKISVP